MQIKTPGGAADLKEEKSVGVMEVAAAANSVMPDQPAIESAASNQGPAPPRRSEESNRQEDVPRLVPQDAQRSEDDLQRANEEPIIVSEQHEEKDKVINN